jgi:hypothetical protein
MRSKWPPPPCCCPCYCRYPQPRRCPASSPRDSTCAALRRSCWEQGPVVLRHAVDLPFWHRRQAGWTSSTAAWWAKTGSWNVKVGADARITGESRRSGQNGAASVNQAGEPLRRSTSSLRLHLPTVLHTDRPTSALTVARCLAGLVLSRGGFGSTSRRARSSGSRSRAGAQRLKKKGIETTASMPLKGVHTVVEQWRDSSTPRHTAHMAATVGPGHGASDAQRSGGAVYAGW